MKYKHIVNINKLKPHETFFYFRHIVLSVNIDNMFVFHAFVPIDINTYLLLPRWYCIKDLFICNYTVYIWIIWHKGCLIAFHVPSDETHASKAPGKTIYILPLTARIKIIFIHSNHCTLIFVYITQVVKYISFFLTLYLDVIYHLEREK